MRASRHLVPMLAAVLMLQPVIASEHGEYISLLVAQQGLETHEAMREAAEEAPVSPLLPDVTGRRNIAETNLNWAAALVANGEADLAAEVIGAALEHQETDEDASRRGLFRWFAEEGEDYTTDATIYVGPTLAHLVRTVEERDLRRDLEQSARLALAALVEMRERPREGYGGAMWAGAVLSLADVVGDDAAAQAGARVVMTTLDALRKRGRGGVHSPTFDALGIGGLRWAWQYAPDDATRAAAEAALGICYADMLQRYDPTTAMVSGAIGEAYRADYLGGTGVARSLLACDLPSALMAAKSVRPLAMYFALSDFRPHEELISMAESGSEFKVRTRTPDPEGVAPEKTSTCTWRTGGLSLGTMSGVVTGSSIPILATCDLPERPTSYFYVFGGGATLHSAQAGPVAICSFDFDGVGVAGRVQVGVRGMLGRRDQIDRVIVGTDEWIGEPRAIGRNVVVALRRGGSYLGMKILDTGAVGKAPSATKPGRVEWYAEGTMDSLLLTVSGRTADYPLPEPLFDVRVGLLVEVAPSAQFDSLEEFAAHVAGRRVSQQVREERERVDTEEERQIPGRHEIRPRAERRYARYLYHEMTLAGDEPTLGLVQEMLRNRLVSRTLPTELPADYLWVSPALTLTGSGRVPDEARQ